MHLAPAALESAIRWLDAPAEKLGDGLETGASEGPQQEESREGGGGSAWESNSKLTEPTNRPTAHAKLAFQ